MQYLLILLSIFPAQLFGQSGWQRLGHESYLDVASFQDSNLFVASNEGRIIYSHDAGIHWYAVQLDSSITSVTVSREGTVMAGGLSGRIYRSADLGVSWQLIQSSRKDFVRKIRFLTNAVALAVGSDGAISRSTDSGRTWSETVLNPNERIRDLDAIATNVGLILTRDGWIYKTYDAGATWVEVDSLGSKLGTCDFTSPQRGMIVGDNGAAFISNDSGNSWQRLAIGTSADLSYGIAFSAERFYVTGYGVYYQSDDGGHSWTSGGPGRNRPLLGSLFLQDKLWAVGYPGVICFTSDSARIWSFNSFEIDGLEAYHAIQVVDSLTYIAVGSDNYISISTNGGITWSPRRMETHLADLYDVHFWDAKNGVAAGQYSFVALTSDGGLTWSRNPPFSNVRNYVQIIGLDSKTSLLRSDSTIWLSEDRFRTATSKKFSSGLTYSYILGLVARSPTDWFATAGYMTLRPDSLYDTHTLFIQTTNGGDTWVVLHEFRELRLDAIHFISDSVGFVGGDKANIWKTNDAGVHWRRVNEDTSFLSIQSISFADSRIGCAAGYWAQVWFTYDQGETWQRDTIVKRKPTSDEAYFYFGKITWADSNTVLIPGKMGILKKRIDRTKLTQSIDVTHAYSDLTLIVMPNPVIDILSVRAFGLHSRFEGRFHLELFDVAGTPVMDLTNEMIARRVVSWSYFDVDVHSLPAGTYLLKLSNGERTYVKKVVVLH